MHTRANDRERAEYIANLLNELIKLAHPLEDRFLEGWLLLAWRIALRHTRTTI
jgi:hypothetical protein